MGYEHQFCLERKLWEESLLSKQLVNLLRTWFSTIKCVFSHSTTWSRNLSRSLESIYTLHIHINCKYYTLVHML